MATQTTTLDCGCDILVYEDGSARPEVIFCDSHDAERLKSADDKIKDLEKRLKDALSAAEEIEYQVSRLIKNIDV